MLYGEDRSYEFGAFQRVANKVIVPANLFSYIGDNDLFYIVAQATFTSRITKE